MSDKKVKKNRQEIKRQYARDNQRVFHGFMVEISAHPFWKRFWFCFKMAFVLHPLQRSLKPQIAEHRRLVRAQKIAAGQSDHDMGLMVAQIASGFLVGIVVGMVVVAVVWMIFGSEGFTWIR